MRGAFNVRLPVKCIRCRTRDIDYKGRPPTNQGNGDRLGLEAGGCRLEAGSCRPRPAAPCAPGGPHAEDRRRSPGQDRDLGSRVQGARVSRDCRAASFRREEVHILRGAERMEAGASARARAARGGEMDRNRSRGIRTRESPPAVINIPASLVMLFLIHHREDRGHRERNVRCCAAQYRLRWSVSVFFSVPVWFLFRQMTPVRVPEHGDETLHGYERSNHSNRSRFPHRVHAGGRASSPRKHTTETPRAQRRTERDRIAMGLRPRPVSRFRLCALGASVVSSPSDAACLCIRARRENRERLPITETRRGWRRVQREHRNGHRATQRLTAGEAPPPGAAFRSSCPT